MSRLNPKRILAQESPMTIATAARQEAIKLHTLLQDKPWNMLLKRGELRSPIVQFDFDDIQEASDHFKPLVRDLAYDCGELAIVTYLQARVYDKALVLLPFVVTGNFHHRSITYNSAKGALSPKGLAGRRVGVRTYSQTTGVWVRGILRHEYGVDLDKVTWVTFDDSHLVEYRDPPNCQRAPQGKKLADMLRDGEVDAAIPGNVPNDPRIEPLIPDAEAAAAAWWKKYGIVPINHMFVVTRALCQSRPDVVREIYRLLIANRAVVEQELAPSEPNLTPGGVEANRKSLEFVIDYALRQQLIPQKFSVDELFDDAVRILGL
jgi:4,5-dihydroxyphthalate decarboxylase